MMMTMMTTMMLVLVLAKFHIRFYDVVGFCVLIASACVKGLLVSA